MKIALVGAHRETRLLAPYGDAEWAIWSCSPYNENELPRQDVWFELHDFPLLRRIGGGVYLEWLKTLSVVWMAAAHLEIPGAREYPLARTIAEFGPYFLTGTISYMFAAAILEKPEAIGIWGVSNCPEYAHQRASLLYFVQMARNNGIEVNGPAGLLDPPPLYAFTEKNEWPIRLT